MITRIVSTVIITSSKKPFFREVLIPSNGANTTLNHHYEKIVLVLLASCLSILDKQHGSALLLVAPESPVLQWPENGE